MSSSIRKVHLIFNSLRRRDIRASRLRRRHDLNEGFEKQYESLVSAFLLYRRDGSSGDLEVDGDDGQKVLLIELRREFIRSVKSCHLSLLPSRTSACFLPTNRRFDSTNDIGSKRLHPDRTVPCQVCHLNRRSRALLRDHCAAFFPWAGCIRCRMESPSICESRMSSADANL